MRKLFCLIEFHKMIEIISRSRYDNFVLNYFHCKHCGKDFKPCKSEIKKFKQAKASFQKSYKL